MRYRENASVALEIRARHFISNRFYHFLYFSPLFLCWYAPDYRFSIPPSNKDAKPHHPQRREFFNSGTVLKTGDENPNNRFPWWKGSGNRTLGTLVKWRFS